MAGTSRAGPWLSIPNTRVLGEVLLTRPEIEQAAPVTDSLFTLQNSFSFSEIVDKERRAGQLENKIQVNLELLCKFSL